MWILLGSAFRNLADRLADMDVLQGDVNEEDGLSIYKYRYQVDVYTHIYLQEGQHLFCGAWATLWTTCIYRIYLLGGATPPLRSVGNTLLFCLAWTVAAVVHHCLIESSRSFWTLSAICRGAVRLMGVNWKWPSRVVLLNNWTATATAGFAWSVL